MFDVLPNPINLGQQHGTSIYDTVHMVKNLLEYDVNIIQDTTKQDGAPIKILGAKQFKQYFPDFQFTDYETGIQNTINYYKGLL
jgi:GDP-L-fucose synthase